MKFFDESGLLHDQAVVTPSENRSLWTAELFLLRTAVPALRADITINNTQLLNAVSKLHDVTTDETYPLPDRNSFKDEGFSRDNAIGFASMFVCHYGSTGGYLASVPWRKVTRFYRRYFQPQDIIFFAYCAGKWWSKLFLPFLFLNMYYSCRTISKTRTGGLDTDGKILTWVRMCCFRMDYPRIDRILTQATYKSITKFLKDHPSEKPIGYSEKWHPVITLFRKYFADPTHPINLQARMSYPRDYDVCD